MASDPIRHTQFLVKRLSEMGLEISYFDGDRSARGELLLAATPFQTLGRPFVVSKARFYTLGHNRLKFSSPRIFFELPALDIGRCDCAADIEAALRKSWSARLKDLRGAEDWLRALGAQYRVSSRGTRLLLPLENERAPPAYVRSSSELLLPSGGPLSAVSLAEPSERRHRPLRNLELPSELEIGLTRAMSRLAEKHASAQPVAPVERPDPSPIRVPRILALEDEPLAAAAMQAALSGHGFDVDTFHDPARAIEAFHLHSYDLVLADARMRRGDGLEFTARVQELAGIEKLPVVLVDNRANSATRRAALAAGASAYIVKPASWGEVTETLADLLDGATWRRFVRYPLRLPIDVAADGRPVSELTCTVGRAGISVQTRRELRVGAVERYRIQLPRPLPTIEVDAIVVTRTPQPGTATLVAGVHILRFADNGEEHWIRLIEEIARRTR